jgi:hypothetical protein
MQLRRSCHVAGRRLNSISYLLLILTASAVLHFGRTQGDSEFREMRLLVLLNRTPHVLETTLSLNPNIRTRYCNLIQCDIFLVGIVFII